jgi:hypothetical protein
MTNGKNSKILPVGMTAEGLDLKGKKFLLVIETEGGVSILASELLDRWDVVRYAMTALGVTFEGLREEHKSKIVKPALIPFLRSN